MSPQASSIRHPGHPVHMARSLVALGVAAGLVVAVVPAAHAQKAKLSDAAREALKPVAQQRPLQGGHKETPAVVVVPTVVVGILNEGCVQPISLPYPDPYHPSGSGPYHGAYGEDPGPTFFSRLHVGAVAAQGSLSSPEFIPSTLVGLRVGTGDARRTAMDLVLLRGPGRFLPGSDVGRALRSPHEIGLEVSVRYQLASATAPFGIAPVAGFRVGRLSWHYQNPILVESDGVLREVGNDQLWHYTPYLGLAVSLVRFKHVEAGVTGLAGFRHYAAESRQGFTNDLFPDDHYRELRFEARFF